MNDIHNIPRIDGAGCAPFTGSLERLFAFAVTIGEYMQAGLVAHGLTRARATVVWQLHRHGPANQRQLARTIGVTARNITALIDGLEASGFVRRQAHPGDRRAVLVHLTDAGLAVTAQLAAAYLADAERLFAGLPDATVQQFLATVDTLTGRLTAMGPNRPQP